MPSLFRFANVAIVLLMASVVGNAQGLAPGAQLSSGNPQGTPTANALPERMAIVDPDKKLSAGDQVTVQIVEDSDAGFSRVVTATGELDVPPLGRVRVSGRTTSEAAGEIKRLLEKDYYQHATVRVSIDRVSAVAVRSGVVYLSGEVRVVGPQELVAGETLTLANAILKAGGLDPFADGKRIRLMRQKNGTTDTTVVNYKKIIEKGDVKNDPVLQDGDRIFVPKAIIVF